jgi:hypothetical protein
VLTLGLASPSKLVLILDLPPPPPPPCLTKNHLLPLGSQFPYHSPHRQARSAAEHTHGLGSGGQNSPGSQGVQLDPNFLRTVWPTVKYVPMDLKADGYYAGLADLQAIW